MGGKSLINGEVEYTSVVAGRSVKVVVRLSSAGMNFCTPSGLELYPLGRRGDSESDPDDCPLHVSHRQHART